MTSLVRPGVVRPPPVFVVTGGINSSFASHLFNVIKSLRPELTVIWVPLASLLAPVSKKGGDFALASVCKGHCQFRLVTESWKFSDSFQKVRVSVNWVC